MYVGYVRIRSEEEDGISQIELLRKVGCERVFKDIGNSNGEKPALEASIASLAKGDIFVVASLESIGLTLGKIASTVSAIGSKEAHLKSIQEDINTALKGGEYVLKCFSVLADLELSLEKQRESLLKQANKVRGKRGGRKPKLVEREIQNAIEQLRDPSKTKKEIAQSLGVSRVTLNASLKRFEKNWSSYES